MINFVFKFSLFKFSEEISKKIASNRDNGRTDKRYKHYKLWFTMRLNSVNAAIGRIQLRHLDEWNLRKSEIAKIYRKNLSEDYILPENKKGKSVYHQIVIKHEKRDQIKEHLTKNGIGTMIHYVIPIHQQPLYKSFKFNLPRSDKFVMDVLSLPSYPSLSDDEVKITCEKINQVLQ